MALDDVYTLTRPGQINATGSVTALHIEQFKGEVIGTMERRSVMTPYIKVDPLRGSSIMSVEAHGQSTLQKITPGTPNDGIVSKFGKKTLQVDTVILAREAVFILDDFQNKYDVRSKIGQEHGKALAKQHDQAFCIQAIKAGALTANTFGITSAGHDGASQVTMAASGDYTDPAKLYQKLVDLFTAMRLKDVDPAMEGGFVVTTPDIVATLSMNDLIINGDYVTADGTNIKAMMLKTHGIPVVATNNYPGRSTVSGNLLGSAYDGDFSKVLATVVTPNALMAAETIPVTTEVFWQAEYKQWFIDAYRSFAVGPKFAAGAGNLMLP